MLSVWIAPGTKCISSVAKDTRTVALNVLAATAFRKSYPFQSANNNNTRKSGATGYRDALQTVLDNTILLLVMPSRLLELSFAPRAWNSVANAAREFQNCMTYMLDEEIKAMNEGSAGTGGLMTSLVRAMDQKQKEDTKSETGEQSQGLSVDEIFGNIFAINLGGHDTTANTLSFALLLLAAYPEIQEWVAGELQELGDTKGHYASIFLWLNRCQTVMHETLRLFLPVMVMQSTTNGQPQALQIGEKTVVIPPGFSISSTLLALHTNPKHWEDPQTWNPGQWATTTPNSTEKSKQLMTPTRGSYIPWSEGPQSCPGNKFSQVEFVAVFSKLLRKYRVSAVPDPGETFEETRARVIETTVMSIWSCFGG